ncbi:unnamed protein product [Diabrotica balteata]|uniref:Uncharacterized protein n=1 Tax=Diabrotica balteata TaxID=107213 RepID=A0A9N9SZP9_DIABA|nr:unnamed protein product [Diabrotica balteata]
MASTSGARAELRAVLSENSTLNVNFIDDSDDSVADKDFRPSSDDFSSQSSEDELQEPIPRLFEDKEVNPEKRKPTRWRQRNEEHYDRNDRKRSLPNEVRLAEVGRHLCQTKEKLQAM